MNERDFPSSPFSASYQAQRKSETRKTAAVLLITIKDKK
jgi:hypothetical protein